MFFLNIFFRVTASESKWIEDKNMVELTIQKYIDSKNEEARAIAFLRDEINKDTNNGDKELTTEEKIQK